MEQKRQKLLQFTGAMAAPFTPFDDNGEVDVSQIPKYLKYLLDIKVDGLYIIGTTGEGYSLTNDEKVAIVKAWRQALDQQNANHLLSVVNISSTCLKESLELAKQCQALGFDAIAVLPPIYYKPLTIADWVDYMKVFSQAAPDIPLYYYHNVGRVGEFPFDISQAVGEALKQIPQFSAFKFADPNFLRLSLMHKKFNDKIKFFMSTEEILLATVTAIHPMAANCAMFNFAPVVDAYKQMVQLLAKSDLEGARRQQQKIIDDCLKLRGSANFFVSAKRQFNADVKHLGLQVGVPRPPLCYQYKW